MRSLLRPRLSFAYVVATLALAVALTTVALAAFAGSDGSLHGCVDKHGRLTLAKAGKKCPKKHRSLTWNRRGATGARGSQGVKGKLGDAGLGATSFGGFGSSGGSAGGVAMSGVNVDAPCDNSGVHFEITAPGTSVDYSGTVTHNGVETVVHNSETKFTTATASSNEQIDLIARADNRSDWVHLVMGAEQDSGTKKCFVHGRATPSNP